MAVVFLARKPNEYNVISSEGEALVEKSPATEREQAYTDNIKYSPRLSAYPDFGAEKIFKKFFKKVLKNA